MEDDVVAGHCGLQSGPIGDVSFYDGHVGVAVQIAQTGSAPNESVIDCDAVGDQATQGETRADKTSSSGNEHPGSTGHLQSAHCRLPTRMTTGQVNCNSSYSR